MQKLIIINNHSGLRLNIKYLCIKEIRNKFKLLNNKTLLRWSKTKIKKNQFLFERGPRFANSKNKNKEIKIDLFKFP